MRCCICGEREGATWCKMCGHAFCSVCRLALFWRGYYWLKEKLQSVPPPFCEHERGEE